MDSQRDSRPGLTVLVVEDASLVRRELRARLESLPAVGRVETASRAEDARSLVERHSPDLIVLDLALPGANGLDLLGWLHRRGTEIPTAILSNHADPVTRRRTREAGAAAHFDKSLELQDLLEWIRRVADGGSPAKTLTP